MNNDFFVLDHLFLLSEMMSQKLNEKHMPNVFEKLDVQHKV